MVASSGHRASGVRFDDYSFGSGYDAWAVYGQSKTALIWASNEIDRRYDAQGLHSYSLHPSNIARGIQKLLKGKIKKQWSQIPNMMEPAKSAQQGAATTVWAATAHALEANGGKYHEDCQIIGPLPADADASPFEPGYASWVYDDGNAKKPCDESLLLAST